jgi:hypothetical protein
MRAQLEKRHIVVVAVLIVLGSVGSDAARAAGGDGGAAGQLLRFGSSARSLAVGDAFVGLADDVSTAYWNPAGLEQLRTAEVTALHAELLDGADYEFFAIGAPTRSMGTFALSGTLMRLGGFERTSLFADLDEEFSQTESAFALSYARMVRGISVGLSVKAVNQSIAGLSGSGMGGDVGVYYRPTHLFGLGAAVQNVIAPRVRLDQEEDEWARAVRGGAALHLLDGRVVTMADVAVVDGGGTRLSGGMEVWPQESFAMRGGYNGDLEQFTAGVGVRRGGLQFDYAYNDNEFGLMNIFSVSWRFGVPFGVRVERSTGTFSPTGDTRDVTIQVQTAVKGRPRAWRLEIRDGQGEVVKVLGDDGAPPEWVVWKGDDTYGRGVADGSYVAEVAVVDALGQEWTAATDVEVLNFSDENVVPMRIEVSGAD